MMLMVDKGSEDLTTVRLSDEDPNIPGIATHILLTPEQYRRFEELVSDESDKGILEAVARAGMRLQMRRFSYRASRRLVAA